MFKEITRGKQKVQNTSIKYIYIYIFNILYINKNNSNKIMCS